MKLLNLQIFPKGPKGWKSELLEFGEHITQLFGPNGCGKTPLVQTIGFCLGFPSVFRNDIYEHCSYAILNIEIDNKHLKIKRFYSREVEIEVTESGRVQRFYNEQEYSFYLFEHLKLRSSNLVTNSNTSTSPYLSTILPIFYLDQDEGYSKLYCPPASFIKDQFSEMMRMLFNLPAKNLFDTKKEKILAKEKLEYLDKSVEEHSRRLEIARHGSMSIAKDSTEIRAEIDVLEKDLELLKSSGASHDDSITIIDNMISSHIRDIRDITNEINERNKRTSGIKQIIHEINSEIETLNLNEEARRVFLSFNEICASSSCQLFSASSDSYSKNLLYLKDQIKDLERNAKIDEAYIEQLLLQKSKLEVMIDSIVVQRNESLEKSEISALVETISSIKNQIFELQNQLIEITKIEKLETKYNQIVIERTKAFDKYQSFSSDKQNIPDLLKVKAELRQLFIKWLGLIHTSNVSYDVTFLDDFFPVLGKEKVSQLKGSTRIRAVLAFHAALIELMSNLDKLSFRFLILDTPKQHEINNDHLNNYMKSLKEICVKSDIQIVFSTTEYHYDGDEKDVEWKPSYKGKEQLMFLSEY